MEPHHIITASRKRPYLISPPPLNTPTTKVVLYAWATIKYAMTNSMTLR